MMQIIDKETGALINFIAYGILIIMWQIVGNGRKESFVLSVPLDLYAVFLRVYTLRSFHFLCYV